MCESSSSTTTTNVSFVGHQILLRFCISGLTSNAWIVVVIFEHEEEYLEVVDLTSNVGIIPAWLASYFLV